MRNRLIKPVLLIAIGGILILSLFQLDLSSRKPNDILLEEPSEIQKDTKVNHITDYSDYLDSPIQANPPSRPISKAKKATKRVLLAKTEERADGRKRVIELIAQGNYPYPVRVEKIQYPHGEPDKVVTKMVANDFLVGLRESADRILVEQRLSQYGATIKGPLLGNTYRVQLYELTPDGVLKTIDAVLKDNFLQNVFLYAEPNYITRTSITPNDIFFQENRQWSLQNNGQNGGIAGIDVDATEGWEIETNASEVIVAIIDSGINLQHEDLISNLWTNPLEIPNNGVDDDENGYVDDHHGINSITGSGDPTDDNGHGTHCAGIIGASANNGVGISGIAWEVKLMPLKFLNTEGEGATSDAIECIRYAIENGATIMNNSWGGQNFLASLQNAIEEANSAGIIFVAAAGNEGSDNDSNPTYPANYNVPNIVSVASINRDGSLSEFSNYGVDTVDVAAPGAEIPSTWHDSNTAYETISGTSMATPLAAGILALQSTVYESDSHLQQIDRLKKSSTPQPSLESLVSSGGIVNLLNALEMDRIPELPEIESSFPAETTIVEGSSSSLQVSATSKSALSYSWFKDGVQIPNESANILNFVGATIDQSGIYSVLISNSDGSISRTSNVLIAAQKPSLSEVLDAPNLIFATIGESDWTITNGGEVGLTHLTSGETSDNSSNSVLSDIQGPGTLEFFWKVSSEGPHDSMSLKIDGKVLKSISGSTDWQAERVDLNEQKVYSIQWVYEKDQSLVSNLDTAFLDGISIKTIFPPQITKHPSDAIILPGINFELSVEAIGQELSYSWTKDGATIKTTTDPQLVIENADASDAGSYSVVVSNPYGTQRSNKARIEVDTVVVNILKGPQSASINEGGFFSATVEATGTQPFFYQWLKDGSPLFGENKASFSIKSVSPLDEGAYTVRVTSIFDSIGKLSDSAELIVSKTQLAPTIAKDPTDVRIQIANSATFSIIAKGTRPLAYQWDKNNVPIDGATGPTLSIESVRLEDAGNYSVTVSNPFGSTTSRTAQLDITTDLGDAVEQPELPWKLGGSANWFGQINTTSDNEDAAESGSITHGEDTFFESLIPGPVSLSYTWKTSSEEFYDFLELEVDGEIVDFLSGETDWVTATIELPGEKDHLVRWRYSKDGIFSQGMDRGWVDNIQFDHSPIITQHPKSKQVEIGDPIVLQINTASANSLQYQWRHNSENIPGETLRTLSIETISENHLGIYDVVVSNSSGQAISQTAIIFTKEEIADAIDNDEVEWRAGGNGIWTPQIYLDAPSETDTVLVGTNIENGEPTWLETTVEGPLTVSFYWKTSIEFFFDFVEFRVNDELAAIQDGLTDWTEITIEIPETGEHTLRWSFFNNEFSDKESATVWIDQIRFLFDPIITKQPISKVLTLGDSTFLEVEAASKSSLQYQWRKNETPIEGEVGASLDFSQTTETDLATYDVLVTNEHGSKTSTTARIVDGSSFAESLDTEERTWEIIGQGSWIASDIPEDASDGIDSLKTSGINPSSFVSLETDVIGPVTISFQWKVTSSSSFDAAFFVVGDDVVETIWGNSDWAEFSFDISEEGTHRIGWVLLTDRFGSDGSDTLHLDTLSFSPLIVFTEHPKSSYPNFGDSFSIKAAAIGDAPLSYQWKLDEEAIATATKTTHSKTRFSFEDIGVYELSASNGEASATSRKGWLFPNQWVENATDVLGLRWLNGGEGFWLPFASDGAFDEEDMVAAVDVEHGESTWLETSIAGPALVSFTWASSSEEFFDRLVFSIDGTETASLSGITPWIPSSHWLGESKTYVLRWTYSKDETDDDGQDLAWLDQLTINREISPKIAQWFLTASANPISSKNQTYKADPDGDGLTNLLEFAYGTDPSTPDTNRAIKLDTTSGKMRLATNLTTTNDLSDVEISIEESDNLKTWKNANFDLSIHPLNPESDFFSSESPTYLRLKAIINSSN